MSKCKVTGFTPEGASKKDFRIEFEGETFIAKRGMSGKFTCEGCTDTIKNIKEKIENGSLSRKSWSPGVTGDVVEEASVKTSSELSSPWDCVHPCAILIRSVFGDVKSVDLEEVNLALDSFGWLDAKGYPDYGRVDREFAKFAEKKEPLPA